MQTADCPIAKFRCPLVGRPPAYSHPRGAGALARERAAAPCLEFGTGSKAGELSVVVGEL
jgi:hypothetical protein